MATEAAVKVTFRAQLVAMGAPDDLELSQYDYDDMAVLVFVAPIEEIRKAAVFFHETVDLTGEVEP